MQTPQPAPKTKKGKGEKDGRKEGREIGNGKM
jgi:hypothetical protein